MKAVGPRVRGKVGQATEPEEFKGKWFFAMWMTEIGAGEPKPEDLLGEFGPWESEEEAGRELRKAVQLASEEIERRVAGKVSGKYIDMKTNKLMSWDKGN